MGVVSIVDGCGLSLLFVSESWSLCRGAVRCRGRSGQIIAKVGVESSASVGFPNTRTNWRSCDPLECFHLVLTEQF